MSGCRSCSAGPQPLADFDHAFYCPKRRVVVGDGCADAARSGTGTS